MKLHALAFFVPLTLLACTIQSDPPEDGCNIGAIITCAYTGPPGTSGIGACHAGIKTCNGTSFSPCSGEVLPGPETCATAVDDDCDGLINEDGDACLCAPGQASVCYSGPAAAANIGACRSGLQVCTTLGSGYGDCVGETLPAVETCKTDIDDDCDGAANEEGEDCLCTPGALGACYTGPPVTAHVGSCMPGVQVCNIQGTGFGSCVGEVLPQLEDCATPEDDDCDGQANQGCVCLPNEVLLCYSGPPGTQEVGQCTSGTQACDGSGTVLGACIGEVHPAHELCGTLQDENCDGEPYCTGRHLWSLRVGDMASQNAVALAVDPSGQVVSAGFFAGTADFGSGPLVSGGGFDAFIAKFDPLGQPIWSARFGDASDQYVRGVAIDASGNIVLAGFIYGTADFGGGALASQGGRDVFVAKFDSAGNHLWSKRFGDGSDQGAFDVAVASDGSVVITGYFAGSIDFGGGSLSSGGGEDLFVVKLDGNGGYLWGKGAGDASNQEGRSVAVDNANDIVVTGFVEGSANLGGGGLVSAGSEDIFIVKYSSAGSHLWSKRFGDANQQIAYEAATDSSRNVLVTGRSSGTVDLGGGPLTSAGAADILLLKLDAGGTHVWSRLFGDPTDNQNGWALAVDGTDNVVLGAYFQGTVNFGGGPLQSMGGYDGALVKFDALGNHLWSTQFGDSNNDYVGEVAVDGLGNTFVSGEFQTSIDLGGGTLVSAGDYDAFIAKLGP